MTAESEWRAVAEALVEQVVVPAFVLDAAGVVLVANEALTRLLGCARGEVVARSFVEQFVPLDRAEEFRRAVADRTARDARRVVCLRARNRALLRADVDCVAVASGSAATLVLVRDTRLLTLPPIGDAVGPYAYEIVSTAESFGTLTRVDHAAHAMRGASRLAGQKCFEAFHGRTTPCDACPVVAFLNTGQAPVVVTPHPRQPRLLSVASVIPTSDATTAVSYSPVEMDWLRPLFEARLDVVASASALSPREREVLRALVTTSDPLAAIAVQLGLSVGTVKFHEHNILNKLGADSRVDLYRCLM